MRLLHKTFSKDRRSIGIICSCGLFIMHFIERGWSPVCPSCGATEDLNVLAGELLQKADLDKLLEEVDRRLDKLSKD